MYESPKVMRLLKLEADHVCFVRGREAARARGASNEAANVVKIMLVVDREVRAANFTQGDHLPKRSSYLVLVQFWGNFQAVIVWGELPLASRMLQDALLPSAQS